MRAFKWQIIIVLLHLAGASAGQNESIKLFNEKDGLTYPFLYSINQDKKGNIVVGTGEGLFIFNGLTFKPYRTEQGLANNFIQSGYTDSQGNIWLGHNNGSVTCYDGKNLRAIDLSLFANSRINRIIEDSKNQIWAISQNDGLIKINAEGEAKAYYKDFPGQICYAAAALPTEGILLAKEDGLFILQERGLKDDIFDKTELFTQNESIIILSEFVNDMAIAVSEEGSLFEISVKDQKVKVEKLNHNVAETGDLTNIIADQAGYFLLCSKSEGILKLELDSSPHSLEKNQLPAALNSSVQVAFSDREGILWAGTYGSGLVKIPSNFVHYITNNASPEPIKVNCLAPFQNEIWVGSEDGIFIIDKKKYSSPDAWRKSKKNFPTAITSIVHASDHIWITTAENGAFKAARHDTIFKPIDLGRDRLSLNARQICHCGDKLFVGTAAGLFQLGLTGVIERKLTIVDGLQHNSIKTIHCEKNEFLWVATEGGGVGTYQVKDGTLRNSSFQSPPANVVSISEYPEGRVCFATEGSGVILINQTDTTKITALDGLFSNYCESISMLNKQSILVTHNGGISIINSENRQVNSYSEASGFGYAFARNAIYSEASGISWIGTDSGLIRYDSNRHRRNAIEPTIVIENIKIGETNSSVIEVSDLPHGVYSIQIGWMGISHLNPEKVTYSYYLDGYDQGWSKPSTDRNIVFPGLQSGNYVFRIKAYNADGYGGQTEIAFPIFIDKPFWQKPWFLIFLLLSVSVLIYYSWRRKESVLLKYQRHLESELLDKTKEITEQKEMLEMRNKDITDSIQYAKNIQKALLPAKGKLLDWLPDSFVFYKPRDIVSGDFYWVEQFGTRLIIACADCTGHGVPGAIMAVLGSGILREISRNPKVDTTAVALQALDRELRQLLQKSGSEAGVDDGMDILLADIHLDTGKLFFSSARRPLLIIRDGEAIMFKGEKTPVGGGLYDQDREFSLQFVQLHEGDCVYFFSDGITDQFGGPLGKKLKTTGFVEFLLSIESHDMPTQYALLRSFFMNWKGIHDQVDDVIVIGFRW